MLYRYKGLRENWREIWRNRSTGNLLQHAVKSPRKRRLSLEETATNRQPISDVETVSHSAPETNTMETDGSDSGNSVRSGYVTDSPKRKRRRRKVGQAKSREISPDQSLIQRDVQLDSLYVENSAISALIDLDKEGFCSTDSEDEDAAVKRHRSDLEMETEEDEELEPGEQNPGLWQSILMEYNA